MVLSNISNIVNRFVVPFNREEEFFVMDSMTRRNRNIPNAVTTVSNLPAAQQESLTQSTELLDEDEPQLLLPPPPSPSTKSKNNNSKNESKAASKPEHKELLIRLNSLLQKEGNYAKEVIEILLEQNIQLEKELKEFCQLSEECERQKDANNMLTELLNAKDNDLNKLHQIVKELKERLEKLSLYAKGAIKVRIFHIF